MINFKIDYPCKEIILSNGEFDGYETEEREFAIDDELLYAEVWESFYNKNITYKSFLFMIYEFEIDITKNLDNDFLVELYRKYDKKEN